MLKFGKQSIINNMKVKSIINRVRMHLESPETYAKRLGVKIGRGSKIATKKFPTEGYLIEIGNFVRVAEGTSFFTHGGLIGLRSFYNDPDIEHVGKIKIGDYTSIGANCMIMPGVTIGKCCIVGGGSVVTKSVPDGCMVAGNPAKFIGFSEDFYWNIKRSFDFGCKQMSFEEKKAFLLSQPDDKFIKKGYIKLPEGKQPHIPVRNGK